MQEQAEWRKALMPVQKAMEGRIGKDLISAIKQIPSEERKAQQQTELQGLILGAYALGAEKGYLYVRAEYPVAIHHLEIAMKRVCRVRQPGYPILTVQPQRNCRYRAWSFKFFLCEGQHSLEPLHVI